LESGPEARPTQPPHPQRIADVSTSDPVDLELYGSPDMVNIDDILSVDVTPLSSISTSGPDMSVAMSVELGTSMAVDFDDRSREIQDTAAALLELADMDATDATATAIGASRFLRNPSLLPYCLDIITLNDTTNTQQRLMLYTQQAVSLHGRTCTLPVGDV